MPDSLIRLVAILCGVLIFSFLATPLPPAAAQAGGPSLSSAASGGSDAGEANSEAGSNDAAGATDTAGADDTADVAGADDAAKQLVVVIGAPGLRWSDVDDQAASIQEVAQSVGSLVVRSRRSATCAADGWLALGTGTRVVDPQPWPCRMPEEPVGGQVPNWGEFVAGAKEQSYPVGWGLLAQTVGDVATFGPGAAIAGADAHGQVANHTAIESEQQLADAIAESSAQVLIVDAGTIYLAGADDPATLRRSQVAGIDARVGAVLAGVERRLSGPESSAPSAGTNFSRATIILAGIADDGQGANLRALAISELGIGETGSTDTGGSQAPTSQWRGKLTSPSTKQPGYALTTDLLATVAAIAGADVPGTPNLGAPIYADGSDSTTAELIAGARGDALQARAMQVASPVMYLLLVVLNLALLAALTIALSNGGATWAQRLLRTKVRASAGTHDFAPVRRLALTVLQVTGVFIASIPVATFLANLLPWWRYGSVSLNMVLLSAAIAAAITLVAFIGPWRRAAIGPVTVVALVTALVIFGDLAMNDTIQTAAPMGRSPIVGGRFYGINNTAFILGGVAALFLAAGLAHRCINAGQRILGAVTVLLVGAVVTVIDGAPSMGADFGGPPALIPAFGIMALLLAGVRLTWRRVLAVGGGTAVVMIGIIYLDWLRPEDSRTHLGNFFQDVLDGQLLRVIGGKLSQNFGMLYGNVPLTLLAFAGVAAIIWLIVRPLHKAVGQPTAYSWLTYGRTLGEIRVDLPAFVPLLVALAILGGLGMAVNDSGIIIPAVGISLAAPLLFALLASWLKTLTPPRTPRSPAALGSLIPTQPTPDQTTPENTAPDQTTLEQPDP